MSSLKTVFVMMLLAGAMYGVYVTINSSGEPQTPPPEAKDDWAGPPAIEMPGPGESVPGFPASDQTAEADSGRPGAAGQRGSDFTGSLGGRSRFDPAPPRPGADSAPRYSSGGTSGANADYGGPNRLGSEVPGPHGGDGGPIGAAAAPRYGANAAGDSRTDAAASGRYASPSDPAAGYSEQPYSRSAQAGAGGPSGEASGFLQTIEQKLAEGQLSEVHLALSSWRNDPRLTPQEAQEVRDLLDQLAGTVIFSREHLLEPPYRVQPGDTLQTVARRYNVPPGLLAKINGVQDPLEPGQELKVVRGPFNAVVDLAARELTLILDGRYAGRFTIGLGTDQPQLQGNYEVQNKTINPTYYGANQIINAEHPNNPLGERWIGLGERIGLHGTDNPEMVGQEGGPGYIRLGRRDIEDLYDILSVGSQVVVR